ncbi:hypothetical protein QBC34DRAFT_464409 [Podospora aff. communis PSN243]|uniref:Uncharacterized protein n=1 Tax=Podospora aff. communis PSN243 TaxID=3040156 RepID=A0AAV9GL81_9PEZI|nr:hypothetical protein QBC34DRAFT_464409 [Podospora aff. communis PSN243]
MSSATSSCPSPSGIELPKFAELSNVPSNVTTVYTPLTNTTQNDMMACCAPNRVHLELQAGCYAWCEVPEIHMHQSSRDGIAAYFLDCLGSMNNGSRPRALGVHMATRATGTSAASDPGRAVTLWEHGFQCWTRPWMKCTGRLSPVLSTKAIQLFCLPLSL